MPHHHLTNQSHTFFNSTKHSHSSLSTYSRSKTLLPLIFHQSFIKVHSLFHTFTFLNSILLIHSPKKSFTAHTSHSHIFYSISHSKIQSFTFLKLPPITLPIPYSFLYSISHLLSNTSHSTHHSSHSPFIF